METYLRQFAVKPAGIASVLALTGIWAQHAWVFWLNTSAAVVGGIAWQSTYLVTGFVMIVAGVLAAAWHPSATMMRRCDAAAALLCALGTALLVFALVAGFGESLASVAKIAAVAGYAWIYLRWGQFYGRLHIRQAVAYLFTAGVIAAFAKLALSLMPAIATGVVAVALPLCSMLMCCRALSLANEENAGLLSESSSAPYLTRENIAGLWKVAVVIVVFSLANASMLSFQPSDQTLGSLEVLVATRLTEALLCLGLLAAVFRFGRTFDFSQLWKIVMFVLATDFLCELIIPDAGVQALFSGVSLNFIVLFVWLTLADVARHSTCSPFLVFGFGWSCYVLPFFVGALLTVEMTKIGEIGSYVTVLLYLVSIAMAFFLESRDQNVGYIFGDLAEREASVPSDFDDIDSRCEALGLAHGLTPREIEVMQLFCKGRTKAYIAETMYVTENTVRSHIKHIYVKLDAHSREDIQRLIDAY